MRPKGTVVKAEYRRRHAQESSPYSRFAQLDGSHPYGTIVPDSHIKYSVRTRHGAKVFYFNFELAREMGLIAADHPDQLNAALEKQLIETFSLVIINEHDIQSGQVFPKDEVRPKKYMATRYLQLQHPNKRGKTSGDGRGIWNGCVSHRGITWDVSSSGTGATSLSPACALEKKFFKTGDKRVCYGNGYADLDDGLSAAMLSEIFHRNGIKTERTLAILSFKGGASINVRASQNLLRPAHFFRYLKLGDYNGLKASVDFFIDRQIANGDWNPPRNRQARYRAFARHMALTFSEMAAQFQSHYIFCWLDWDGDNILANGGIIDYGSVRQFGLYHHEYRYDDGDRYSTRIPEQKRKARYIVQTFAQLCDFLITGKKKNINLFKSNRALRIFDLNFERVLREELLRKVGFNHKQAALISKTSTKRVRRFEKIYSRFERATSVRGIYALPDGLTSDAIYCMRDVLRELPRQLLRSPSGISPRDFIDIAKSSYARKSDLKINTSQIRAIKHFQRSYIDLIKAAAKQLRGSDYRKTLLELTIRSSIVNQPDRITGNGVIYVTDQLIRNRKKLTPASLYRIISDLAIRQAYRTCARIAKTPASRGHVGHILLKSIELIAESRDSV